MRAQTSSRPPLPPPARVAHSPCARWAHSPCPLVPLPRSQAEQEEVQADVAAAEAKARKTEEEEDAERERRRREEEREHEEEAVIKVAEEAEEAAAPVLEASDGEVRRFLARHCGVLLGWVAAYGPWLEPDTPWTTRRTPPPWDTSGVTDRASTELNNLVVT